MEVTVLQLLEEKMEDFTATQKLVADYILKNPTEVAFLTTDQLSAKVGVSVATIMRLAYTLGYTGYSQFQKALQEILRNSISPPARLEENVKKLKKNGLLVKCAELQIANINKTVEFLSDEVINKAFDLIFASKKIYIIGVRASFPAASFLNDGLNRLGMDCEMLVPDTWRLQAILAKLSSDDLVIAISLSRYSKRTIEVVKAAKSRNARILSITDGYSSPLVPLSDVFLGSAVESLSFHRSLIGSMFIVELLITGVAIKDPKLTKRRLDEIERISFAIDANIIK